MVWDLDKLHVLNVLIRVCHSSPLLYPQIFQEEDKRPSGVYKDVIIRGAREHNLPSKYVKMLESVEDNGYRGNVSVNVDLRQISKVPDE